MTIYTDENDKTAGWLLLTPPEAAEVLRVSRSTVYELMARGELESVHIGTARRVPREALVAYVEALRTPSATA